MIGNIINYRGSLNELPSILERYNASRILFVTGKSSFADSEICTDLLKTLNSFNIVRHSDFDVNPKLEDINKGIALAKTLKPECIIGIGGGSVMDTAKLIAAFWESDYNVEDIIVKGANKEHRNNKLILIPTTAGSGSEATHFAVIYINGSKYSYATNELLPDHVILDSRLTDSAFKHLTAVTAFDAFSQAIESYWATGATAESLKYAEQSIQTIVKIFNELITNPGPDVRDQMLLASYNAGRAINISKTTAPHALSYAITMKYGIPHGHAVALTLPLFIEYNSNANIAKLNKSLAHEEYTKRYNDLLSLLDVRSAFEAQQKIVNMMKLSDLPATLSEIGVDNIEDVHALCKSVNVERLNNNPMSIKEMELFDLLKKIFN